MTTRECEERDARIFRAHNASHRDHVLQHENEVELAALNQLYPEHHRFQWKEAVQAASPKESRCRILRCIGSALRDSAESVVKLLGLH